MQNLYIEYYKTLWGPKWIEGYIPIHGSKDSKRESENSTFIFPNASRDSMQSKSKPQQALFMYGNYQVNSKIYIKIQTAKNSEGNPKEEQSQRTFTTK